MRTLVFSALLALALPAQAAPLTLACTGTITTNNEHVEQVSKGVVIDLQNRTVQGLVGIAQIDAMEAQVIRFNYQDNGTPRMYLSGSLDRITGELFVTTNLQVWRMNCRPAQRMF